MKKTLFALSIFIACNLYAAPALEYYKLIVYHYSTASQEKALDDFISQQYLPALHGNGFKKVGVFKPITNDTAKDKQLVILINGGDLKK